MKRIQLYIVNISKTNAMNENILLVHYITKVSGTDLFHGYAILTTYCEIKFLEELKKCIMKKATAYIDESPIIKNGIKYYSLHKLKYRKSFWRNVSIYL